ncbi:hypothetical protein GALL_336550 [mine drainage metagenome]|uniref:DUF4410 domain-containing protein n=1 Tax=mine drainage metagenome TaxID=410659 RepID=A0A1J5QMG6_9ZZZZ
MRRILALAALCALAACSGPVTSEEGPTASGVDGYYGYGVAGRDLRLEVAGNAFAGQMSDAAFDQALAALLKTPPERQPGHITLTPGPSARSNYSLVFLFNPGPLIYGQELCAGQRTQQPPQAGRVKVVASFCVAGRAITEITGQTDATGLADDRFGALMEEMMGKLFRTTGRFYYNQGGHTRAQ